MELFRIVDLNDGRVERSGGVTAHLRLVIVVKRVAGELLNNFSQLNRSALVLWQVIKVDEVGFRNLVLDGGRLHFFVFFCKE